MNELQLENWFLYGLKRVVHLKVEHLIILSGALDYFLSASIIVIYISIIDVFSALQSQLRRALARPSTFSSTFWIFYLLHYEMTLLKKLLQDHTKCSQTATSTPKPQFSQFTPTCLSSFAFSSSPVIFTKTAHLSSLFLPSPAHGLCSLLSNPVSPQLSPLPTRLRLPTHPDSPPHFRRSLSQCRSTTKQGLWPLPTPVRHFQFLQSKKMHSLPTSLGLASPTPSAHISQG